MQTLHRTIYNLGKYLSFEFHNLVSFITQPEPEVHNSCDNGRTTGTAWPRQKQNTESRFIEILCHCTNLYKQIKYI